MFERRFYDPDEPSSFVVRKGFWFHVDGTLSAAYMPFLEMAHKNGLTAIKPGPVFDFRLDFVMSIVTSGHAQVDRYSLVLWGVHHQEWAVTATPKCDFHHQ